MVVCLKSIYQDFLWAFFVVFIGKLNKAGTSIHPLLSMNTSVCSSVWRWSMSQYLHHWWYWHGVIPKYELWTKNHAGICHLTDRVCRNNTDRPRHSPTLTKWLSLLNHRLIPRRKALTWFRSSPGKGKAVPSTYTHTQPLKSPTHCSHGLLLLVAWSDFLSCPESP